MNQPLGEDGGRPLSKYAQKQRDRELGLRPEFEFVDKHPPPQQRGTPVATPPRQPKTPPSSPPRSGETRVVFASVKYIVAMKGCLFLYSEDEENIFAGLALFNKFQKQERIRGRPGDIFECEIEQHPNGKGPRVKRFISMLPRQ